MGILVLNNNVLQKDGAQIDIYLNWLKRECKAQIIGVKKEEDVSLFWIEGVGIPKETKRFTLYVTEYLKGVVTIEIEKH